MEQNKMNEINGGAQEENALAGQEKKSLPMIALRGKVVFPKTFISFDVGRQISLAAVNAAAENGTEVFIAAQKNALVDTPSKNDLNRYADHQAAGRQRQSERGSALPRLCRKYHNGKRHVCCRNAPRRLYPRRRSGNGSLFPPCSAGDAGIYAFR